MDQPHLRAPFAGVVFACLLSMSACGLKGPLYRPADRQQASETDPADPAKLRRPRPAPQVQKEDRPAPSDSEAPAMPPDPEQPNPEQPNPEAVESLPADESQ